MRNQLPAAQENEIAHLMKEVEQREVQFKVKKAAEVITALDAPTSCHGSQGTERFPFFQSLSIKSHSGSHYSCPVDVSCSVTDSKRSSQVAGNNILPQQTIVSGHGEIVLPEVLFGSDYSRQPKMTSTATTDSTKKYLSDFINKSSPTLQEYLPTVDVIGDNVDLTKTPSHLLSDNQRQSLHWFLNVGVKRRIVSDLPDCGPQKDLLKVNNVEFLPNSDDCNQFDDNCVFHIVKVLVKYIECLNDFEDCVPEFIEHPHIDELSKKSEFVLLDLLDKNENKADDMISILQDVHSKYIAHTDQEIPIVLERKVFGGDVLTAERTFGAQRAMMNAKNEYYGLSGVVPRPEGLHRMMNYLSV
jgi:hypothetical protein